MQQPNKDKCLEYTIRIRKSDQEVRDYLRELGVENASQLQRMNKEYRDAILTQLKRLNGVSLRQLSRITGISKSVIHKV